MTKVGLHPGMVGSISGGIAGDGGVPLGRASALGTGTTAGRAALTALAEGPALGAPPSTRGCARIDVASIDVAASTAGAALEPGGVGTAEGGGAIETAGATGCASGKAEGRPAES